jgi:hypothetical protein
MAEARTVTRRVCMLRLSLLLLLLLKRVCLH